MRPLEFLGIGGERNFRTWREQSASRYSSQQAQKSIDEPTKGMIPPSEPQLDPRITEAIVTSKPTPPKKRRLVGTYAEWISDPAISPADTNPEFVNILRAVVSDDNPLSIDQVAELSGIEIERVEDLVTNVPYISVDTVDGQKQIDMPDVQNYLATWKEEAIQKLPEGTEPEIVNHLLTPLPVTDTVFELTSHLSSTE
jgi:hypothetical protein